MFDNHSKPDRQKWRSGFIFVKNSPILRELERNGNKKPVVRYQVINIIANFASRNKPTQYVKYTRQYNRFREHIRSYYYAAYDDHPHSRGYVQPQQADEGTHRVYNCSDKYGSCHYAYTILLLSVLILLAVVVLSFVKFKHGHLYQKSG